MYSLREYLNFVSEIYSNRGLIGVYQEGGSYLYESLFRQLQPLLDNDPDYILDREWNVLVILDACRVDALEDLSDEYEFLPTPPYETIWSADSYTEGWFRENFTGKQALKHRKRIGRLVHISANPCTEMFESDKFGVLDEVWKYGWDEETGYIPPEVITDRAVQYHRSNKPDQMLVHYMQPHAPFINEDKTDYELSPDVFGEPSISVQQRSPWDLLRDDVLTEEEVWEAYLDNLRVVLDEVETLVNSVDAEKVVISANYGNGVGEWGVYGHPRHIPLASVRQVPWVEISAKDTGEYTPSDLE